jgi:uncharacterized protein
MPSRMRPIVGFLVLVGLIGGCSSASDVVDETPDSPSTTVAATDPDVPPQLADVDLDRVIVGDRLLLLAIADSPALRGRGLMGVTDLGDLDGMLFYWRHEASGAFWMKDTLIPLDIVWFDEDGAFVGRASMVPCTTPTCPEYSPGGDVDYRYAIEANPGALDWVDGSTVIVYED